MRATGERFDPYAPALILPFRAILRIGIVLLCGSLAIVAVWIGWFGYERHRLHGQLAVLRAAAGEDGNDPGAIARAAEQLRA